MEKIKKFNKTYLAVGIVLLIFILLIIFGNLKNNSGSVNLPIFGNKTENLLDSQIILDKTKVDTSFVPVSNANLILEKNIEIEPDLLSYLNQKLIQDEARLASILANIGEEYSVAERLNLYFSLSADYKSIGQYGKAKEMLEKAFEIDGRNSNMFQIYSTLLYEMGDKENALIYVNKAIGLYSGEVGYWLWKIDLEKGRGVSVDLLDELYKLALKETDNNINALVLYARFLENNNKKQEAINIWEEAKKINPENSVSYDLEINRLR